MKAAGILFVTPDQKGLFLLRSKKSADHVNEYDLPGGKAEENETRKDTARREAFEETGHMAQGKLREIFRADNPNNGVDYTTFQCEVPSEFEPDLGDGEHTEYVWALLSNPPSPLHPGVAAVLKSKFGMDSAFEESKHPRAENGQFGSGSGNSSNSLAASIKDKSSAAYGGQIPQKGELRKLYHTTSPEAAIKIIKSGFKSSHSVDPELAKASYGGLAEKDAGEFVYFGLNKEASENNAVSDGITFIINAEPFADKTVLQKEQEGGIALVKHNLPQSAIVGITNIDKYPQVKKAWEEYKRKQMAGDSSFRFALDRASARSYDTDGRMHVSLAHISKANVCPYFGSEIPGCEEFGLDPQKVYQLLRDPEELKKAAKTSNNIQLLAKHIPVSIDEPQKDAVVGSTGTDAVFNAPYLDNSLVIWDSVAIAGIESGEQKELSCGYRYRAEMKPGVYEGVHYDGVMRDIVFNHVALVEQGRAGSDVVVGDSLEISMSKKAYLSRKAALAKGALAVFLQPKLAQDAKIDLHPILADVKSSNWASKKMTIAAQVRKACQGKLAQDANIDDIVKLLNSLDGEELGDKPDDNLGTDTDPDKDLEGEKAKGQPVEDEGPMDKIRAFLKGKISDDDLREIEQLLNVSGSDEDEPNMEGGETEVLAKLKALIAKMEGGSVEDEPPATPGTPAPPATSAKPVEKSAMDAASVKQIVNEAVRKAEKATMQRMADLAEAKAAVRPIVGEIALAQDSAESVYRLALEAQGIDVSGVHPSAYKAMVAMLPKNGNAAPRRIAQDAKITDIATRFPTMGKVRQLG